MEDARGLLDVLERGLAVEEGSDREFRHDRSEDVAMHGYVLVKQAEAARIASNDARRIDQGNVGRASELHRENAHEVGDVDLARRSPEGEAGKGPRSGKRAASRARATASVAHRRWDERPLRRIRRGAPSAANLFSLIASCPLHDLDPEAYLAASTEIGKRSDGPEARNRGGTRLSR